MDAKDDNGFAVKGGFESRSRPISFLKKYNFSANVDYVRGESVIEIVIFCKKI